MNAASISNPITIAIKVTVEKDGKLATSQMMVNSVDSMNQHMNQMFQMIASGARINEIGHPLLGSRVLGVDLSVATKELVENAIQAMGQEEKPESELILTE